MCTYKNVIGYLFSAVFLCVCFAGCRSAEHIFSGETGTPPSILYVQSGKLIGSRYLATSSFHVGDQANFKITIMDPDLDVQTLYIRGYYPKDALEPFARYAPTELLSQEKERQSFVLEDPFTMPAPSGEWRVELQVEDTVGQRSNIYKLFVIIH
jgi:hypothetical protein